MKRKGIIRYNQRLLLSGDVELNPGPPINFKFSTEQFARNKKQLKFFHVNCQSMLHKKHRWNPLLAILEKIVFMDSLKRG